jgi:hypothetical protein
MHSRWKVFLIQIQKMGRWQGTTFKEYVRKELASFSEGMSKK